MQQMTLLWPTIHALCLAVYTQVTIVLLLLMILYIILQLLSTQKKFWIKNIFVLPGIFLAAIMIDKNIESLEKIQGQSMIKKMY